MNAFTKGFDSYACVGDSITCTVDGFDVTARIEHDAESHIDDCDTFSTDQSITGCNDEQFAKLLDDRRAWLADEWHYCGIVLSVARKGVTLDTNAASLWGLECNFPGGDNSYLTEVANELLDEALKVGRDTLERLQS